MNNIQLPVLIKRCLTYGIRIYPYELDSILSQYEDKKVPDNYLSLFDRDRTERYVRGLSLCSREDSVYWKAGFNILEELGFEKKEVYDGIRIFVSLVYTNNNGI